MSLKLNIVRIRDVTVMELSGRVTLGEGSMLFRDAVCNAVWRGDTKIALDYDKVTYQDSSAVGELVSAITTLRNSGGELVFFNLGTSALALFQVTKLYKILDIFDSREAALAHFDSSRSLKFKVTTRRFGALSVLALAGSLDDEHGGSELLAATNSALDLGAESVVLLFRQVFGVDRSGLETLLSAHQAAQARGAKVMVAGVDEMIRPVVLDAALSAGIPVHDTLDGAMAFFGYKVSYKTHTVEVTRA